MIGPLLLTLALGQFGYDGVQPYPNGAQAALRASWTGFGPTIADDAKTVAHVTWNGTALVDSKGNSWTMQGTVPQVADGGMLFPNGASNGFRSAAGPFSSSNYYKLGTGADVLDFTGDFSVCAVTWEDGAATPGWVISNGGDAVVAAGWAIYRDGTHVWKSLFGNALSLGGDAAQIGPNIVCIGRAGTTCYEKSNLAAIRSGDCSAMTVPSAIAARIGLNDTTNISALPFTGQLYEVWASSTTPSDALFINIMSRFFGQVADTGQPMTFTRASTATATIGTALFGWPAGVARVTDNGLVVEPAATNLFLRSTDVGNATSWATDCSAGGNSITSNAAVGPDGSTTAAKFVMPSVSGAYCARRQNVTLTNATTYTHSVWLKMDSSSSSTGKVWIYYYQSGPGFTVTAANLTQSWQRFTNQFTAGVSGVSIYVGVDNITGGTPMTSEPAQTIDIADAQLEQTALGATSFIATTSTTATRPADAISFTTPSGMGSSFSMSGTFRPAAGGTWNRTGTFGQLVIGTAGSNNTVDTKAVNGSDTLVIQDNAGGTKTLTYSATGLSGAHKMTWQDNSGTLSLFVDGVTQGSVTGSGTGLVTTWPASINIGSRSSGQEWRGQLTSLCAATNARGCKP